MGTPGHLCLSSWWSIHEHGSSKMEMGFMVTAVWASSEKAAIVASHSLLSHSLRYCSRLGRHPVSSLEHRCF